MQVTPESLAEIATLEVDEIIDVRSPTEFAEDHLPGAINLPVLTDAERAEVGKIYVQDDRFKARKIGAALVARNAARHLETTLADRPGSWRPLVYCWRGGQRSGSFASILEQIGWRVQLLTGGYKTYRGLVVDALYERSLTQKITLIDGNTGTGKTALLAELAALGHQVIDLEALANHRGSILGGRDEGQPSQKAFESHLAGALTGLDADRPLILEAEANKIGDLLIPPSLWSAMRAAPRLRLAAPIAERAGFLVRNYSDVIGDLPRLEAALTALIPHQGREVVGGWIALAREGEVEVLAADLMERHYDPRYARAAESRAGAPVTEHALDDLSPEGLRRAAAQISGLIER